MKGYIPIEEINKLLPVPVTRTTIQRWARDGLRGKKWDTIKVGHKRYSTRQAAKRFAEQAVLVDNGDRSYYRTSREKADAEKTAEETALFQLISCLEKLHEALDDFYPVLAGLQHQLIFNQKDARNGTPGKDPPPLR